MLRTIRWSVLVSLSLAAPAGAPAAQYSIKTAASPVPKEVKEPIAKLLSDQSVQLLDDKGKVLVELWFRKEVPAKVTPAQVKNGVTYRDLQETTLLAVARFAQQMTDYRKQKIKPGVYTLRLAFQPMDGDHMGTAPYGEFCLVAPADKDEKPDAFKDAKELHELSTKATGTSHPGVFLLFPNKKPEAQAKLESKAEGHWVLNLKQDVNADGKKGSLGVALTLIGHSSAE